MLNTDLLRKHPDQVKQAVKNKLEKVNIDTILDLDKKRRALIQDIDNLRHQRKEGSQTVAQKKSKDEDATKLVKAMAEIGKDIKIKEKELRQLEEEFNPLLLWVPNIPEDSVPVGKDESTNKLVRSWGKRPSFDYKPKPHWELGKHLDIIDLERATKISGTSFSLLKGPGARLERALINFMLDLHIQKHHYQEIAPPYLVKRAAMETTGQLPKLDADMYHLKEGDSFLIPTAEVPLTNFYSGEILKYQDLPQYFVAATPCFRLEAGSYGKDTKGLMRVHQFNKVELVKFVHPEQSFEELEKLTRNAEAVLQALGLEYRVMTLSTGEMSFASAKTYDLEAWAPGLNRYLEVSSCSNFTDFQARRGNIRFRDRDGKIKLVHTLNGSGLALPRTLICLLETYQRKDGSVEVPEVLRSYMNGLEVLTPTERKPT